MLLNLQLIVIFYLPFKIYYYYHYYIIIILAVELNTENELLYN